MFLWHLSTWRCRLSLHWKWVSMRSSDYRIERIVFFRWITIVASFRPSSEKFDVFCILFQSTFVCVRVTCEIPISSFKPSSVGIKNCNKLFLLYGFSHVPKERSHRKRVSTLRSMRPSSRPYENEFVLKIDNSLCYRLSPGRTGSFR